MEFALGSTILVTVFAGVFQYGFIFYQYNALENAVINGAHFASQRSYDSLTSTPSNSFQTAVQNMVVYGDPTGTNTTPLVRNLGTGNVNISVGMLGSGTALVPISVTVSISWIHHRRYIRQFHLHEQAGGHLCVSRYLRAPPIESNHA